MSWIRPLELTLQLMGLSVLLAAATGITLAFLLSMIPGHNATGRGVRLFCLISLVGCIATPMILHAAAWEATAGKFGWLTFSQTAARNYTGLAGRYGGMVACVWIHGLFGAAIVTLATWLGTARIASPIIDQSRLDGGPIWIWWRVRLPIAAPWVLTGLLATAILAATEMTVVDLYGVRTLADEFYLFHAAQPSLISIMMVLVLPCILAIAVVSLVLFWQRRRFETSTPDQIATIAQHDEPIGKSAVVVAALIATTSAGLMFIFPLAGLVLVTGRQIVVDGSQATMDWSFGRCTEVLASAPLEFSREYLWTAALALSVGVISVVAGWLLASATRQRPALGKTVDALSLLLFLIPGPIIGLALVRFFTLPIPGFHSLYHESLLPTIVALLVRALPISFWIIRAGYSGIDSSIIDVAQLDLSWVRRMWTVDRPLLARTLLVAGFASAIMASGDVPVSLPVLPPEVVTVGTRLFALLHSGARNQEAALSFWYVGSIVLASVVFSIRWKPTRP